MAFSSFVDRKNQEQICFMPDPITEQLGMKQQLKSRQLGWDND